MSRKGSAALEQIKINLGHELLGTTQKYRARNWTMARWRRTTRAMLSAGRDLRLGGEGQAARPHLTLRV